MRPLPGWGVTVGGRVVGVAAATVSVAGGRVGVVAAVVGICLATVADGGAITGVSVRERTAVGWGIAAVGVYVGARTRVGVGVAVGVPPHDASSKETTVRQRNERCRAFEKRIGCLCPRGVLTIT